MTLLHRITDFVIATGFCWRMFRRLAFGGRTLYYLCAEEHGVVQWVAIVAKGREAWRVDHLAIESFGTRGFYGSR